MARNAADSSNYVDFRTLGGHLVSLGSVAAKAFFGSILVFAAAGALLAALSYYFLREAHWLYGAIGIAVALVESLSIGTVFATKHAVTMAIVDGLDRLKLGRMMVHQLFAYMIGADHTLDVGERGGAVTRKIERVPLAQSEALLGRAVEHMLGNDDGAGWLKRKVKARLIGDIKKYTLARLRGEGAKHGGIDLVILRDELEGSVDGALVEKVRGAMRLWTIAVVIGLPLTVALQTWLVIMLLHSKG